MGKACMVPKVCLAQRKGSANTCLGSPGTRIRIRETGVYLLLEPLCLESLYLVFLSKFILRGLRHVTPHLWEGEGGPAAQVTPGAWGQPVP